MAKLHEKVFKVFVQQGDDITTRKKVMDGGDLTTYLQTVKAYANPKGRKAVEDTRTLIKIIPEDPKLSI